MDDDEIPELQEPVEMGSGFPLSPGDGERKRLDKLQKKLEERRDVYADKIAEENLHLEIEAENQALLEDVFGPRFDANHPPDSFKRFESHTANQYLADSVWRAATSEGGVSDTHFEQVVETIAADPDNAEIHLARLVNDAETPKQKETALDALRDVRDSQGRQETLLDRLQGWLR